MQNIVARFARARAQIKIVERLPVWRLRLLFGAVLMVFSELVVWQNPPGRQFWEWPLLLVLYASLGSIMLDLLVRYQVHTPAGVGMVAGIYGLVSSSLINHTAFISVPIGLLIRGLGLQVGAGFLALMLFVVVMRGRRPDLRELAAAALVGVAWGIWVHWYPIQTNNSWGLVTLEDAQTWLLAAWVTLGGLFFLLAPRFGTVPEAQYGLYWWEVIIVGAPLYIALGVGIIQGVIPLLPLLLPVALTAYCFWAVRGQRPEYDPSILGEITFVAPNIVTYVALVVAFLMAGSLVYPLVDGIDAFAGVAMYFIVLGFGSAWLPFASGLMLWSLLRTEYRPRQRKKRRENPVAAPRSDSE